MSSSRVPVGVAGATGAVGQRFLSLLSAAPDRWDIVALGASQRSAGQKYGDVVHWVLAGLVPPTVSDMTVGLCTPDHFKNCKIVFSALDSSVAGGVEEELAKAGIFVASNARNHRQDPDVPILLPTVNPDQIGLVHHQRKLHSYPSNGAIVTNANCSSTGLAIALAPLVKFNMRTVHVVTMQAVSGGGYPGVSSLDIMGNIVPYISGEEDKLENESKKILGTLSKDGTAIDLLPISINAHCNRVPVMDGHTESVTVSFADPNVTVDSLNEAWQQWDLPSSSLMPSSPAHAIEVMTGDRPQPRLDVGRGGGYTVCVGRVRKQDDVAFGPSVFNFTVLSHNTVIGAAGGSILNAELALAKGLVQ